MEKPEFLTKKYSELPGSKPVERAVQKKIEAGEKGPKTKEERVEAYLDRIEKIISSGNWVSDERGWELLKNKIVKEFAIDTKDPDTLVKIAHGLYESEKKLAIEQGRGRDIERIEQELEHQGGVIERYKGLVKEKREIQEKTLSSWLDYLKQNDAQYPMWFRYFVVRNLQKMGTMEKEKGEYAKRTAYTVAPFPELNSEALGFVYRMLSEGTREDEFADNPEKRKNLEELIAKKDFSKLYAFAQIETAGRLNRESIEGEWIKYDQGSDYHILENTLKSKGTGWCTAEGSAYSHLQGGDFYVYFTKGPSGEYTEPRIAIRMENDQVAEVRGVNKRQELEPVLVDIAEEQYHLLPGGKKFYQKSADMKKMTELTRKQEKGEQFTKNDLTFLYEIDSPIEGFGYDKDPRIKEIREQRNPEEDMPIIFECAKDQIAHNPQEINENTKAYIGKWSIDVFQMVRNYPNTRHLYESFPEKKIFMQTLETDPTINSPEKAEKELKNKNMYLSDWAKDILYKTEFSKEGKTYNLVRFTVEQLGFLNGAATDEIYKKAEELGLELCPAEVGPHFRLQYLGREWMLIAMKQITDRVGGSGVFCLRSGGGLLTLRAGTAEPAGRWRSGSEFVFRFRKLEF